MTTLHQDMFALSTRIGAGINRRSLMAGAGATIAMPFVLIPGKSWAVDQLVFVAYGGVNQAAYENVMCAAFTRDTGIKVISLSGPDPAKIKAQVLTKNVEWDVTVLVGGTAVGLESEGLLEPIDSSIVEPVDGLVPHRSTCFSFQIYWGGIAYDPKRTPAGKVPGTWAEFFDVKAFPGRRGLRDRADEMVEIAAMADGIPPKQLYPLDLARAFRALDRVKPSVTKFIHQTPQTISLIHTGEIDFSYTYAGRVDAAKVDGMSIEFVSKQPLVIPNFVGAPKGGKNRVAAMKLLNYFMRPDMQAACANALPGTAPVARAALPLLNDKTQRMMPNFDAPTAAFVNVDWWAKNFTATTKRYKNWLLA